MAKLNINIGASANDKSGDTLRVAFGKANSNFAELYTLTGGTSAALTELAQDYAAPMFNHASHTNITATYDDANNKILLTGVAAQVQSNWTAASGLGVILNKPALFSGSYTDLTNKPTGFSSLVNSTKTVSLDTNSTLTLPAPLVHLTNASQLATDTAKIYRATNSTDTTAITNAWDTWYGNEWVFRTYVDADESNGSNYPWHGLPSWEAYPLIMNYLSNPPGGSQLPPNPALAPAAKTASDSYLSYKELVSSIDIVNGNKTISFNNTGLLSLPGTLEFKDTANAKIILKQTDSYGYVVEDPTLHKTWTFGSTGNTTFPTGLTLAAARGPNTVNFLSGVDKEFQIETQTSSTSKLWSFKPDGSLTLPDNSVIASYKPVTVIAATTTAQTITDSASAAFIQFVETVDTASAYSTGTFTAPYTGYYQINMSVYFSTTVTLNSGSFLLIDTNLDNTKQVTIINGSWTGSYLHYSTVIPATAGDAIRVAFRQVSGADIDVSSGSRLTIHRVSIS